MLVIIILLGAFLGYYYFQSSSEISSLNQTVTSQSSQLGVQAQQIASDNAKISSDTSEITNLTSRVSSLQDQIAVDEATINSVTAKDLKANETISTLNSQISTDQSKISSDQSQVSTLQSEVSSLQSQVSSLEAVTGLSQSEAETSAQSFTTGTNGVVQVATFQASYAGYVSITVTAASDPPNEGPQVDVVFASSVHSPSYREIDMPSSGVFYSFSSSSETIVVPVAPGIVNVYLETSDTTAQTATISVVYYY